MIIETLTLINITTTLRVLTQIDLHMLKTTKSLRHRDTILPPILSL